VSDYTYQLPSRLDRQNLESFYSLVESIQPDPDDRAIFDFSTCDYVSPTGAAALLSYRDTLKDNGVEPRAIIRQDSRLSRFLSIFGMPIESDFEDAYTSRMRAFSVPIHRCTSSKECLSVQSSVMEKIVRRTGCAEGTEAAIDYMINEIWDNAGVHGYQCYNSREYPNPIYIGAFSYRDEVEVVIADRGQGIHPSLQKIPQYRELSAKEALERALENEVSGHPDNSPGFGLYSAAQFVLEGQGTLAIWSSGRQLVLSDTGKIKTYGSECGRDRGTLVSFSVDVGIEIPFESVVSTTGVEEYLDLVRDF
jgi:anti-sigma regulatory factor (Ser/Thr protein kinase)/anti-anti-sigma regulatory factor